MEDSGIESDSKTVLLAKHLPDSSDEIRDHEDVLEKTDSETTQNSSCTRNASDSVIYKGPFKTSSKLKQSSILQKRLEKQMLQTRKQRQREQSLEGLPKKLIPRNRLKVPKSQSSPSHRTDSHPLVSWESESDDEIDYHPISKSAAKEISEQLIKDGYNLVLTPEDEDLDLIPPKPPTDRCICCSMNCTCLIQ